MNDLVKRLRQAAKNFRQLTPTGLPVLLDEAADALRTAQERGEAAEPVAWRYRYGQEGWQYSDRNPCELLPENTKAVIEPLYAAPAAPVDEQTEREAFEKWYLDETGSPHYIEKDSSGDYFEQHSRNAWRIWKAARAQRRGE